MIIYCIGGLGADERVFQFIDFQCEAKFIKWIEPANGEALENYANRLKSQIDVTKEFAILGVSFGGLVAIELSKLLKPQLLILISSVESHRQLPKALVAIGRIGFLKIIPRALIKPPKFLLHFLFGAKDRELLSEIIDDTDPSFIKWALHQMLIWENELIEVNLLRIHGTNDKLIPLKGEAHMIKKGGHFMIVDNAIEIAKLINPIVNNFKNNYPEDLKVITFKRFNWIVYTSELEGRYFVSYYYESGFFQGDVIIELSKKEIENIQIDKEKFLGKQSKEMSKDFKKFSAERNLDDFQNFVNTKKLIDEYHQG